MKAIVWCPGKKQSVNKFYHCQNQTCDESCIFFPIEKKHPIKKLKIKKSIPDDLLDIYKEQFFDKSGHLYFLGLLAYPKLNETPKVVNFVTAAFSEVFKTAADHNLIEMSDIGEKFRTYEKRKAQQTVLHTLKRIERRLLAAWIVLHYINKWEKSLNDIIKYILIKKEYRMLDLCSDRTSIIKNIWSESKPVLHLALAVFPMLHKIYDEEIKPDLDMTSNLIKQIKRTGELSLRDLCIISGQTARRFNINEKFDLLTTGWLSDILKVSEVYYDFLPAMIPFVNKEDLIKLS